MNRPSLKYNITVECEINCNAYTDVYWYHPDYLGNTEYVSDIGGFMYQHFFYTPFGEALVSQHANTGRYDTEFRFNGKEQDPELQGIVMLVDVMFHYYALQSRIPLKNKQGNEQTGLYYYGARYYNPRLSVWLSVDPHHFNYPTLTPYAYVANNPVNMIDPDGRDIYVTGEGAADFVDALQARTRMTVSWDEDSGKISFEGKKPRGKKDKMLMQMATDENIDVEIEALKSLTHVPGTDGEAVFSGGAHIGTGFSDGCATSKQLVNTDVLESMTEHFYGEFDFVMHELYVAYGAGLSAAEKGVDKSFGRDEGAYDKGKKFANSKGFRQAPDGFMHRQLDRFNPDIYIDSYNGLPKTKIDARTGKRTPWKQD